jgi:hypothetical protein
LCWAKSAVHQLVDLSRSRSNLITLGLADVPKISFETDFMIKKAKYGYRMETISMADEDYIPAVGISPINTITNTTSRGNNLILL